MTESKNREQQRRRFSRFGIDAEIIISDKKRYWESKLIDISLNGVLITRPSGWEGRLQERYRIKALFCMDVVIYMDVEVAHIGEKYIGLCRQYIDMESISILRRLVELNLGDDAVLQRELSMLIKG